MEKGGGNKFASVKPEETHGKFNRASFVSLVLAAIALALWIASLVVIPEDHRISFTKNFHVGVWKGYSGEIPGRLVIFNGTNGPWIGGTIAMDATNNPPPILRTWYWGKNGFGYKTIFTQSCDVSEMFCELPGIHFTHIKWSNHPLPIWTLMIGFWLPFILFSILPMIWISRQWRLRRSKSVQF